MTVELKRGTLSLIRVTIYYTRMHATVGKVLSDNDAPYFGSKVFSDLHTVLK